MDQATAEKEFHEGLKLFKEGIRDRALEKMKQALEHDPNNPLYMSHLGLLMGKVLKKFKAAEEMCTQALKKKRTEPQFYLNLAELYVLARRKEQAVDTLTDGLKFTKRNPKIHEALRELGIRRPLIVPFLSRNNALNRDLGWLRHKVMALLGAN